jgi:hypothetical protein
MYMESGIRKKMADTFIDPPMALETDVVDFGQPMGEFVEYLEHIGADLLLIPKNMLKGTSRSPFRRKSFKLLTEILDIPVALC